MTDRKKCSKIKVSVYSLYTNYICLFILYIICKNLVLQNETDGKPPWELHYSLTELLCTYSASLNLCAILSNSRIPDCPVAE